VHPGELVAAACDAERSLLAINFSSILKKIKQTFDPNFDRVEKTPIFCFPMGYYLSSGAL
jgi:hypothetical protein